MNEIKAKLGYLRISPRKVRLVTDLVKGMPAETAIKQLSFANKRSAPALIKLLKSAISNAKNNLHLDPQNLYVKEFRVDEAPTFKRFMPRARGSASTIRKRRSHVLLILEAAKPKKAKTKIKSKKK